MKQCIRIGMRELTPFLNRSDTAKLLINRCLYLLRIGYRVMGSGSALDLVTTACDTPLRVYFIITTTTCTTAAYAIFPLLSTNELAMVKMKKKKREK